MSNGIIPFSMAQASGLERTYIDEVLSSRFTQGDGPMTTACEELIGQIAAADHAVLVHSGTAALELAMLLARIEPGDEVILPSYTFTSTANAIALRGGVCVFVDIRPDTLNIDDQLVEAAINTKTKAIMAVHYAGVVAEMHKLRKLAERHGLVLVEDAAQAVGSTYHGEPAGSLGHMGCFSFHETKNIISGEGGALTTSDAALGDRAAVLCQKGTNRRAFMNGQVDKYQWMDLGSSYHPSELVAAMLRSQLEEAHTINAERMAHWLRFHDAFAEYETRGIVRRPHIPSHCEHNAHMYYLVFNEHRQRDHMLNALRVEGIMATFHYIPLHSAPAGRTFGTVGSKMDVTDQVAGSILRLPLHRRMEGTLERIIERVSFHLDRL